MATLTSQSIVRSGLNPNLVAADVAGDDFVDTGKEFLYINNGSGAQITVTLDIESTVDGQPVTDPTIDIPAGEFRLIGPFTSAYRGTLSKVSWTYSAVGTVTVGVLTT